MSALPRRSGLALGLVLALATTGCATWKPVPTPVGDVLARPKAPGRLVVHLRDGSTVLLTDPVVRADSLSGRRDPQGRRTAFEPRTKVVVALADVDFVEVGEFDEAATLLGVLAVAGAVALLIALSIRVPFAN